MSGDDAQRAIDPGDPGPKGFQVFLSHSGRQKAFVAQLDKDLRGRDLDPFFDEDVEKRCLPIGEKVQDRIFKAIEDCRVGVVILSEDFFTRTVWPMLELEKMVECKKKIMPVFLGISPEELSNESKLGEWISAWKGLEQSGMKVNIANWVGAVKHLGEVKGLKLVYQDATGPVKFREEIVKEVRKEAPPRFRWDDSHVQGGTRLSKVIQAKIRGIRLAHEGVQVVGLHGVGGIGKTTACKSLCKDLFREFDGRVCHIEFGVDSSERSELERVQEVLKRLTNVDNGFLKDKNKDECWSVLQEHLASKKPLSPNKVFLAIDNVSVNTRDEVRRYRSLKFNQGSIVMVIARELDELERNNIESSRCLTMPELVEEEARALFVYYAEGKNGVDEGVIMEYVNRCYFGKGDAKDSKHYHPLALRVLGSQMVGRHPLEWKSQLRKGDVFNRLQEEENPVFLVLRRSFDTLKYENKMLFMDVALLDNRDELRRPENGYYHVAMLIYDQMLSWDTFFKWLSIVHGISMDELKEQLNVLKKMALLEEVDDGTGEIGMHDLWQEFAIMETKHGEEDKLQWVYEESDSGLQRAKSCMSGGGWKKLRRIFIELSTLGSINFNKCLKVEVLRLSHVYVENGVLDLSHLKSIKSLEIVDVKPNNEDGQQIVVSGIDQLLSLGVLVWLNIDVESSSVVEEISCLTNLRILHLEWDLTSNSKPSMSLDLQRLRYLQDVRVELPCMVSISGFSLRMKGLRILDLTNCHELRSCVGVGDVDGLEVLLLRNCWKLEELPNLQKLIRLRVLVIHECKLLKTLPGLESLVSLQVLYVGHGCLAMKELPNMSNLAKLEVLDLRRCCELKFIPGLGNLVTLRKLGVHGGSLDGLTDLRNLTRLQEVEIYGFYSSSCKIIMGQNLALFESISTLEMDGVSLELSNLSKLTAVKSLELRRCTFKTYPDMEVRRFERRKRFERWNRFGRWDGVWDMLEMDSDSQVKSYSQVKSSSDWTLPYLEELRVHICTCDERLDLCHFPQLRLLNLLRYGSTIYCHAIHVHLEDIFIGESQFNELPDLGNFPFLRRICIRDCTDLRNLAISKPLLALSEFNLSGCYRLHTAPNTDLFPGLLEFSFEGCGVHLGEHEVQKLVARGFRRNPWNFWVKPSSDVVLPPASELNWHADEQAAMDAPNDLAAGPSQLEPCTSEFIPYNESLSEFGKISLPKPALELGSSSGSDQEQTNSV